MKGKRLLLGVTGGIAAYKSAELVRRLIERGAEVQVVMTDAAREFITPLTFQALSGRPVRTSLWDVQAEAAMGHIELARWADLVLVSPASADFLARLAHGLADDLLATLCLAMDAQLAVAPAMNQQMWMNATTVANMDLLRQRGVQILGPAVGSQACGEFGPGRALEAGQIADLVAPLFYAGPLQGRRVLLTAGPTRECLDPVRFITNRSSGKMGFAVAQAMAELGAQVVMVAGPVSLPSPAGVQRIDVENCRQMYDAVHAQLSGTDIFIATAAVADYRPAQVAEQKIKKASDELHLDLTRTQDILASVAAQAGRPFVVGFAAETTAVEANARIKLVRKNLDLIAANEVGPCKAFDCEDNALIVLWPGGRVELPRAPKLDLARSLATLIVQHYEAWRQRPAARDPARGRAQA